MASALYDAWVNAPWDFDLEADTIKARLVSDDDYTFDESHANMSSVTKYGSTTDQTLASKTMGVVGDGIFDAGDATWSTVAIDGSKKVHGVVVYKFVTDDAGSTPLFYIDFGAGDTGAVTPNGTDILVAWNAGGVIAIAEA